MSALGLSLEDNEGQFCQLRTHLHHILAYLMFVIFWDTSEFLKPENFTLLKHFLCGMFFVSSKDLSPPWQGLAQIGVFPSYIAHSAKLILSVQPS